MKSNSPDDPYDSITVTTTTTRAYSLRDLDYSKFDNPKEKYDQHLTLHSLVSFKEELSNDSGVVGNHLRILTNSGFVKIVGRPHEEVSSFAVLQKGMHKLDPSNPYDPTIKVGIYTSPEIEGVSCVLTSDKYDPIYTKLNYSDFLFFMNIL
jgi:hypothetical protein